MNLPFFKKTEKIKKEYFLSLIVRATSLAAILFEEENKALAILATADEKFDQGMENATSDELTALADKVISAVEGSIPDNGEVSKTVFAVPQTWVEDGKIKRENLLKLKKVCDTLALVPIGFIISVEAVIAYLQQKQGAPLTSLFVEHAGESVTVYLVKAGNIVEQKTSAIEESVLNTTEKLFGEFDVEVFPSKIVLFDHTGASRTAHDFMSHKWPEDLPFLHVPKTEALEKDFENEAIVHGVATQMGFEVLTPEIVAEREVEQEATGVDLGFVKDQDIAQIAEEREATAAEHMIPHMKREDHENLVPVEETVVDTDQEEPVVVHHSRTAEPVQEEMINEEAPAGEKRNPLAGFFSIFHIPKLPSLSFPGIKGPGILIGIVVLAVVLLGGVYAYYANIEHAEIDITLSQKQLQKDVDVTFQQKTPTSVSDKVIGMNVVSQDVDGQDSVSSTGKTDTGDKAKGSVTIYNKTSKSLSLPKGTTIVGPNNLKFDLTGDATVASTSAFDTNISNTSVNVQADSFGSDYNIPSGSNFTVNGAAASDYFAKNSAAFSGGTKKSVTSVSQADLDGLLTKVQGEITSKALSQATSQVDGDTAVIPQPISTTVSTKKYDHKVGDQVATINLSLTVTYKFGTYKKSDLESIVSNQSSGDVPQGFTLAGDKSQFTIKDAAADKSGNITATVSANAVYIAHIDTSAYAKQYTGKSQDSVERALSTTDGVSDVSVTLKNSLPFLPKLLPLNAAHIVVIAKSP